MHVYMYNRGDAMSNVAPFRARGAVASPFGGRSPVSAGGARTSAALLVGGVVVLGAIAIGISVVSFIAGRMTAPTGGDGDSLANVPVDDEAETPEEAAAASEGYAALSRGEVRSWAEARHSWAGADGSAPHTHSA